MAALYLANARPIPEEEWVEELGEPLWYIELLEFHTTIADDAPWAWSGGSEPDVTDFADFVRDVVYCESNTDNHWYDGSDWTLIGRICVDEKEHPVAWFRFTAGCDGTGFACRGGMSCVVASSLSLLVEHGLRTGERSHFAEEATRPGGATAAKLATAATRIQAAFRGWRKRRIIFDPNTRIGRGFLAARFEKWAREDGAAIARDDRTVGAWLASAAAG